MSKIITSEELESILNMVWEIQQVLKKIESELREIDDFGANIIDIVKCAEDYTDENS